MNRDSWIILGWTYVLGLVTTGLFYFDYLEVSNINRTIFIFCLCLISTVFSLTSARLKYFKFKKSLHILMIGVFIFAPIYFQLRTPKPQSNDISYELNNSVNPGLVLIQGTVINEPRITASGNIKFWFKTNQFTNIETTNSTNLTKKVSGKLYVTVPLLEGKNIYPKQLLQIQGLIYKPKSPQNPGQFNFKKYLQSYGCFAGFKGLKIIPNSSSRKLKWGWWKVRKRIIRAQVRGLGSPVGQLVSSIVLGRRAVDLPQDIRNLFITTGLAHILAASGFHVSLLLGMVLRLTSSLQPKIKLWIGLSCLLLYSFLTGFSPSVIRAILMGSGVLIAICIGGKVKPLGSLFLSLIIILLVNPLWIWNLGLQLSFLATLGLIVSVPALEEKLDWMPPLLATTISVPIAASIWTLPLIIFTFNTIASYSILVNIVSMPLVTFVSLGGMVSSFISLISPSVGSLCASLLYYPCLYLIKVTQFFSNLPGSNISIGRVSFLVIIIIYGSICLIWLNSRWRKRWNVLLFLSITVIIVPVIYSNYNLFQISVLAANKDPIIVIQDQGQTILINSGKNSNTVKYTIIPFLTSQGINKIDYGIALGKKHNSSDSWSYLQEKITVQDLINENNGRILLKNKVIKTDLTEIREIPSSQSEMEVGEQGKILVLKTNKYNWLIADNLNKNNLVSIENYIEDNNLDTGSLVVVWSGNQSELKWLNELKPDVEIALSSRFQDQNSTIARPNVDMTYIIEEEGAVIWNPKVGFNTHFQSREYKAN